MVAPTPIAVSKSPLIPIDRPASPLRSAISRSKAKCGAGASYTTGPWGVSFTYQHGENQDNDGPGDEESDQYLGAISYALAKGVSVQGYGVYVDFEEDDHTNDVDGFIIGTGVKIKF